MPFSQLTHNLKNGAAENTSDQDAGLKRAVSRTESISHAKNSLPPTVDTFLATSPEYSLSSHRSRPSFGAYEGASPTLRRTHTSGAIPKQLKPFVQEDIKVLLLENVNLTGREILSREGYQVEALKSSLSEDQLIEKIKYTSTLLPIRAMTNV